MILVSIAYLIFNDLMEMIQTNQKNVPHHKIFYAIRVAVSIDHSSVILTSTDTRLSGERIIQYDSLRWSIESFFKFAKQNLSLSKCQIRSEQAQKHDMILVSIAYLIFNDLMEMIQTK